MTIDRCSISSKVGVLNLAVVIDGYLVEGITTYRSSDYSLLKLAMLVEVKVDVSLVVVCASTLGNVVVLEVVNEEVVNV